MNREPDDVIVNVTTVEFDWLDRLRILLGRKLTVRLKQEVWIKRGHRANTIVTGDTVTEAWVAPFREGAPMPGSYARLEELSYDEIAAGKAD